MIVSWKWLNEFVPLDVDADEVARRLMMAGLNHEGTESVGDDLAIDLEVTSNRPDCLGHIGVAREASVLFDRPLSLPAAEPKTSGAATEESAKVSIQSPDLCYRYIARVVRGVQIGPSPDWLVERLQTIGIAVINNVADITNYVMFETGQPLHAFDSRFLAGGEIIVREARGEEQFTAIDHRQYKLDISMCVIADRQRAVALGGVMGGADSEVSESTTDILIESAQFSPLSIRNTARKLNLHSPSSYRFERGVDPHGIDWASRRCCELILNLAGGALAPGAIDVGTRPADRKAISLRFEQLPRILGIEVPGDAVQRILRALGNKVQTTTEDRITVQAPSWRGDLTREIDLIEEVARIHGYEEIPEDVAVPMWPSHRSDRDRVVDALQRTLNAAGYDEAVTASLVPQEWSAAFSPWSATDPIQVDTPMKGILADAPKDLDLADNIRRSLVPSLLEARRYNESVSNPDARLFEIAKVYLPRANELPEENWMMSVVGGDDFYDLKGLVDSLLESVHATHRWEIRPVRLDLLEAANACELLVEGKIAGFLGIVAAKAQKQFGLRAAVAVAEIRIDAIEQVARLIPQYQPPSPYPPIARDLNLIVDESLRWADLARTVRGAAGQTLETLRYQETYRDPQKDGAEKKRLLFSFKLRAAERTLTGEEADEIRDRIVTACREAHAATLLA
jgi:phenylalanyl-tRNA synthetase beta chain